MRRLVGAFMAMLMLMGTVGCGSSNDGPAPEDQSVTLNSTDMADWPLTASSGILRCEGSGGVGAVSIEVGGTEYAVNGTAKSRGLPAIDPVWADNPSVDGLKKDIGPLISKGLGLCK